MNTIRVAQSKNSVPIRLTYKQWAHIIDSHDYMAGNMDMVLESVPYLLKMPSNRIWVDYDEDADVLYISFQKPQHADDSEMIDNVIYHYRDKELVGVTVVGAKKYGEYGQ